MFGQNIHLAGISNQENVPEQALRHKYATEWQPSNKLHALLVLFLSKPTEPPQSIISLS